MLSKEQSTCWQHKGYAVLPGFKTPAEVAAACQRAAALVEAFEPGADPGAEPSVFSTRDRHRVADTALLASADQVRCFFEEEAMDSAGRLCVPKAQSINKIGHALHELDPVFEAFSHGPALAELALDLGLAQAQVWQSQLIFKQPRIGGEVGWHQDASFFVTTPQTVTTFWFALEDATLDNGCLWVEAGGHRGPRAVLRERYVCEHLPSELPGSGPGPVSGGGQRLRMEKLSDLPWPSLDTAVALPVPAGSLVVFGGLLPHRSAANRSARSRLAYTLHATDASAAYSPLNWLQRGPALPVRGFL